VQSPIDDRFNYGEEHLRARITGALGGRAAKQLVYRVVTTGAESDLRQVTQIAHQMVVRWGMSRKIGPLGFSEEGSPTAFSLQRPYSEANRARLDALAGI
jgi:cell division protease FtsH